MTTWTYTAKAIRSNDLSSYIWIGRATDVSAGVADYARMRVPVFSWAGGGAILTHALPVRDAFTISMEARLVPGCRIAIDQSLNGAAWEPVATIYPKSEPGFHTYVALYNGAARTGTVTLRFSLYSLEPICFT